jgi:glycosyltransferase involved in cell wall biosynthesis
VPCHDDGETIEETLASLEAQEPCELVVVDDGSMDPATLEVLDRLRRGGTLVVRQGNEGPAAARMAGVANTTAPYVFPLDADDLVAPGALAALADALDANPDAEAAWGDERTFGRAEVVARQAQVLDAWLITHVNDLPIASLVRRTALLAAGGWQMRSGYEDWDLWLAFAERGFRGMRIPRITAHYRLHRPRRWAENSARHGELVQELRARHTELFARRRRNWARSRAPLRARLLLPVVASLPIAPYSRHRIAQLVLHPLRLLRLRLARRSLRP